MQSQYFCNISPFFTETVNIKLALYSSWTGHMLDLSYDIRKQLAFNQQWSLMGSIFENAILAQY